MLDLVNTKDGYSREELISYLRVRKPSIWVLTRSDTNQPVQSQKQARSLKFRKDCTIHAAKTKALICFAVTTKLICAFVFPKHFVGFLMQ